MSKMIHNYTAANSIDASADYLLIDPASSGIYKSINRNTLLGLASQPLGLTDSQSPQNKTFDNTNSITVKDGSLTIQNSSSTTKQAVFSASSITAGQTRTLTIPDASGTLTLTAATQTLTNKTLTSPTITGGTIDNSTITVDSISGHTSATTVTVANLQILNGVLNTANSVTATAIANGAVQPQHLVAGTGSGWSWQTWTPTFSGLTVGNGTLLCKYIQAGKAVFARLELTFGTTTSVSGATTLTLPVTSVAYQSSALAPPMGNVTFFAPGTGIADGKVYWNSSTTAGLRCFAVNSTYSIPTDIGATVPIPFGTNSQIAAEFFYEAA